MEMADRIKQRRLAMGYTQEELAEKLGLQKSAIAKYENGRVENIKRSVISNMATVLECSPTYIMGWDEDYYLGENLQNIFKSLSKEFSIPTNELIRCFFTENFTDLLPSKKVITLENMRNALKTYFTLYADCDISLTHNEREHIIKYRTLDPHGKDMVDTVLNKEADRIEKLENESTATITPMRFMAYYQRMASAGSGEYLFEDIPTDLIEVEDTPLSRKADFVLGVNGHSMEPTYYDGDKVLVRKTSDVPVGNIGVFIKDGKCYIKELGKNRLISHNEDKKRYPDILPDEKPIDTIGEVLGKI